MKAKVGEPTEMERLDMSLDDLIGMERKAASKKATARRGLHSGRLGVKQSTQTKAKGASRAAKRNQSAQVGLEVARIRFE